MTALNIIRLLRQLLDQYLTANDAQISCKNGIIIFRPTAHILKMCGNSIHRRRSHAGSHIEGILHTIIHDLPRRYCCDGQRLLSAPQHTGTSSGHCPAGRQRTLISILQREAKFFFSTGKMAGGHTHHIVCCPGCHHTAAKDQSFSHSGAGAENAKIGDFQLSHTKRAGHPLSLQISGKQISDLCPLQTTLFQCCFGRPNLQFAFCFFPAVLPKHRISYYLVKQLAQGTVPFFFSYHRSFSFEKHRYVIYNTSVTFLHRHLRNVSLTYLF